MIARAIRKARERTGWPQPGRPAQQHAAPGDWGAPCAPQGVNQLSEAISRLYAARSGGSSMVTLASNVVLQAQVTRST